MFAGVVRMEGESGLGVDAQLAIAVQLLDSRLIQGRAQQRRGLQANTGLLAKKLFLLPLARCVGVKSML